MKVGYNFCLILKSVPRIAFTWGRRTARGSRTWITSLLLTYILCLKEIRFLLPIWFIIITHSQCFTNLRDFRYSVCGYPKLVFNLIAARSWACGKAHMPRGIQGDKKLRGEWVSRRCFFPAPLCFMSRLPLWGLYVKFFFLNSTFSFPKGIWKCQDLV